MKPPLTGTLIRGAVALFLILVFPGLGYLSFQAQSAGEEPRSPDRSGAAVTADPSSQGGFSRFLRAWRSFLGGEEPREGKRASGRIDRRVLPHPSPEGASFVSARDRGLPQASEGPSRSTPASRSRQIETPAGFEEAVKPETSVQDELLELQAEYEIALSRLFESQPFGVVPSGANPFRDALNRLSVGGASTSGPPSGDTSTDAPQTGDRPRSSLQGRTPTSRTEEAHERTYSFLVLGDATGEPRLMSPSPAMLDQNGSFVLENSMRVTPFFGSRTSVIAFEESDVVTTADVDGNGLMDFVVARSTMLGSDLRLYLQTSPRRFELIASSFLYRLYVKSLAVFDMTGDGQLEIVFAAEGSPHLLVFRSQGAVLDYYKEVALPFRPGLLLDSATGGILREPRLHVLDSRMEQSVALITRRGEVLVISAPVPLDRIRSFSMDYYMTGGPGVPVTVLENSNRVLITEQTEFGHGQFASFERRFQVPLAIIGDFLGRRSRQLVILP